MERLKKFESDFQKYLRLRKVLRIIEAIALLVVISFLLVSGDGIKGIIACSCAILLVPESFLAVYRSGLKGAIKNHILLAEEDIKFYSEMKSEFEKMKAHAAEGAKIVHKILEGTDDINFHIIAENVAHYHHERWDGSGYPEHLEGDDIPFEARIMAVADVYDALVSKRVYKEKMSYEKANAIIMDGMGKHFDKRLEPYYVKVRPLLEAYYDAQE